MTNVNQKNEIKLQSHTKTSIKQKIDLIVAGTVDHQKLSIEGMVDIFNAFTIHIYTFIIYNNILISIKLCQDIFVQNYSIY